jgi:tRNA dimethylallyltransferase
LAHPGDMPVIVLYGPTASGKSGLALALARALDGVVINADSMQVYRDLRVLTARPSPADEATVPHRLYGVLDADDICTAARWRDMAIAEIDAARANDKVAILCGGTGFYLRALTEGLSPIPDIPDRIRAETRALVEADPVAAWERMRDNDPDSARRIEPMDRQRISRALEVLAATGRTLSDWRAEPLVGAAKDMRFLRIALDPPRRILRERCDARLEAMVADGALAEVEALTARALRADRPATRAVGVPEFAAHLRGEIDLVEALARAKAATRQYAKRQATWMKTQYVSDFVEIEQFSERSMGRILSFIRENGLIRV